MNNHARTYASIYTVDGNELSAGMQTCRHCDEARQAARETARERQESVVLLDADGDWLVHPDGSTEATNLFTDDLD